MSGRGELLVGVDVGTTMTKAAVVTPDGEEVAWGSVPTPWYPVPTGAEMGPLDILAAVASAVGSALDLAPPGPVAGLAVTSMAETMALLGKNGEPVAPAIAWHDSRGQEEAADLVRVLDGPTFSGRTGLAPSPTCTLAKLAWRSRHHGSGASCALSVADWVVHALGGERVSEASLASRTGALVLAGRTWWVEALEWAGVPVNLFPPVVQAGQLVGYVTDESLEAFSRASPAGHPRPRPATGSGTGVGRPRPHLRGRRDGGRSGPVRCSIRAVRQRRWSGRWHRSMKTGCGGRWLPVSPPAGIPCPTGTPWWAANLSGSCSAPSCGCWESTKRRSGRLTQRRNAAAPGSVRVVRDGPYANLSIVDVGPDASPAALWNAALDEAAEGAARIVRTTELEAGPADELVLTGGWSHLAGLRERKRRLLSQARWPDAVEAGARGAALFGGCAAGLFSGPYAFPKPRDLTWAEPAGAGTGKTAD